MASLRLPDIVDITWLKEKFYSAFHIEVPLFEWEGMKWMRISIQGYNTQKEVDTLISVLERLLESAKPE